ncbi:MAG: 1-acyl-sn-glycerol-3-phosphate acyltransferase [Candidatus Obscuribacterales bacterium]|nr:1-acyl-sn-glycerol-3-phosphate acyltransferase [Candidatus Obscuribacterales bacterium]
MLDFRPPLDSPLLLWWCKTFFPIYMKFPLGDLTISIEKGALERFHQINGERAMICPNHSNRHDPQTMFAFSREAKEYFNFVAAREIFDYDGGRNGWWVQHAGGYSIVRGAADRESFKTTRRILAEGKKKLVLFPEGEVSRQNDTLMTLESGAAQLCFWALSDLDKNLGGLSNQKPGDSPAKIDATGRSATIFILPMALKYIFPYDISGALRKSLEKLEAKVGLKPAAEAALQPRLMAVCERLLTTLEKEYELKVRDDATMNDRVKVLRLHILQSVASKLKVELPPDGKELEYVRILRNKVDDFIYQDDKNSSSYERSVHEEKQNSYRAYYRDIGRVINFVAIYAGYVSEHMTQERFSDVIERLEVEILGGEPSIKGPREVLIDIGQPIDLSQYYDDYKTHKKETITKVTEEVAAQISAMLVKLEESRKPIYLA